MMKKDIVKSIVISVILNIILILTAIDLLHLIENKMMYVIVFVYVVYKVIYEMYIVYRGIYLSQKYSVGYRDYNIEKVCEFCSEKATYKKILYENICNNIYTKEQREILIKYWTEMLENFYCNKLYAIVFLIMNVVLLAFLGKEALGFIAAISIKVILEGVKHNREEKYLNEVKNI